MNQLPPPPALQQPQPAGVPLRPQPPPGVQQRHRQQPPPQQPGQPPQQQQHRQQQHGSRPPGHHSSSGRPAAAAGGSKGGGSSRGSGSSKPSKQGGPPGASVHVPPIAADCTSELEQLRRGCNFKCSMRFRNDLPEIPSDPKLVASSFEPQRLSEFFVTSIEQQPRRELLLPADVGVPVSLLDLDRYDVQQPAVPGRRPRLDPADEALLQDVEGLPTGGAGGVGGSSPLKLKRATKGHAVPWLMSTTYLTSASAAGDAAQLRRGGAAAAAAGGGAAGGRFALAGQQGQQQQPPEELTREQQLEDIEATFAAAQSGLPLAHPKKAGVTAVRCLPILPDLDAWPNKYVTVVFEGGDPANDARAVKRVARPDLQKQLLSASMLKSYQPQGSDRDPAMGLLVPMAGAAAAANGDPMPDAMAPEEVEGDYSWECEYSFELQGPAGEHPHSQLLLVMRPQGDYVGYAALEGNLRLKKRKRQEGDEPRPQKAEVLARDYADHEVDERQERLLPVDPQCEAGDAAAAAAAENGGGDTAEDIFGGGNEEGEDDEEDEEQGGLGYQ